MAKTENINLKESVRSENRGEIGEGEEKNNRRGEAVASLAK